MYGKILRLSIESFKGINNLDLDWENGYSIMAIIADGGLGKSSIVSFVESCLTGVVPEEAINLATKKAKGTLEFELEGHKYTVDISKTKKSETVRIKSDNNMSGGKEVLRKLVGQVTISPFILIKMDSEQQVIEFKRMFNIDTSALETKRQTVYTQRTLINGQVKTLKITLRDAGILDDKGNVNAAFSEKMLQYQDEKLPGDLPERLSDGRKNNNEIVRAQNDFNINLQNSSAFINDIKDIDEQMAMLQKRRLVKENLLEELTQKNDEIKKLLQDSQTIDLTALETELKDMNDHNTERGRIVVHLSKVQELQKLQKQSAEKTDELQKFDKEIEDYIKSAVPDLGGIKMYEPQTADLNSNGPIIKGIYWNEKPINILSTTEAITFGMALKAAVNPHGLPIILLDDFESVGSLGRLAVDQMASNGWQALIAEVDPHQSNLKVVLKKELGNDTTNKTIKEEATTAEVSESDKESVGQQGNGIENFQSVEQ